jgi:hypothetical protein
VSFSIRFPHADDRCYLANCYPYSYSDLICYLRKLQERRQLDDFLMIQSLCTSQAGNLCPLITITSLRKDGVYCSPEEIAQRGMCVISARVHPGESNSSFMVKGVIDFLLDASEHAQFLRDQFVWKIVPMLNPDGVVNGNHRCSLSGKDLNREFINPDRFLNPTIYFLKELVRYYKMAEGRNVMLYGDFHGHSRCRNFIIFACSARKPTCGIIPEKIFPRVLGELAPYFSYSSSTYKVQRSKRTTGRVVFYKELGIRMSFTLEGSMMGGHGCDFIPMSFGEVEEEICRRNAVAKMTCAHFNTGHYQTLGAMFVKTLLLIMQGDRGLSTKVNDHISELIFEATGGKKGQKLQLATVMDDEAAACGSYAASRRLSRKKKAAAVQIAPATPQELSEVYRVLLRNSGASARVAPTDGEDPEEDEDSSLVDDVDDDDNDSDAGDDNDGLDDLDGDDEDGETAEETDI